MDRAKLIEEIVRLQMVSHRVARYKPDVWLNLDLTICQLKSLFFIEAEGTTNAKKLANALGVTPPDVTRIVDRLVKEGLGSRRENPEDRRMLILQVAGKGRDLLASLRENKMIHLSHILSCLSTEELVTLDEGLTALIRAAEVQRGEKPREYLGSSRTGDCV
jgi:DNA-binding MarR family transcriptional regulator